MGLKRFELLTVNEERLKERRVMSRIKQYHDGSISSNTSFLLLPMLECFLVVVGLFALMLLSDLYCGIRVFRFRTLPVVSGCAPTFLDSLARYSL